MTDFPHSRTIAAPTPYTPSPAASSPTPWHFSLGWLISRVIIPIIGLGMLILFVMYMLKKDPDRNKTQAGTLASSDYQAHSSTPPTPTPTVQEPHNPFDSEWRNPSA